MPESFYGYSSSRFALRCGDGYPLRALEILSIDLSCERRQERRAGEMNWGFGHEVFSSLSSVGIALGIRAVGREYVLVQ